MTAQKDEREPGGPIDRELTRRHEVFTAKVEAALDIEAGLRDILLQSRHEAFTAKVETALDVETGLSDILTPPATQAPPNLSCAVAPSVSSAAPGGSRWQTSPAQRLKLRSNPRVAAASRVLHVVGTWTSASAVDAVDPDSARALDSDLFLVLDVVLADDLRSARTLARAVVLTRNCASAIDSVLVPGRFSALDRAVLLARARTRTLERTLDRALVCDPDFYRARDLDRDLISNLALAHDLNLDLDIARDLERARDLDLALDRALDRARDLAHDRARARARALDRTLDRARCRCLQIINDEYTQVIGAPVEVDEESLASLMDDFTTDDLSDADVREDDANLAGVRWSDRTTWPASTDVERLKLRSNRQEDGSWIIRAGTGNVRRDVFS